jgi:Arc/MetJ-type ribon-helix-helix transcriptional regulator
MVRTQIQLTEAQARALRDAAARQGRSMAELVRDGVELVLGTGTVSREERKRRALAASGKFHSGLKDIARNHDRYLAEDFRR